MTFAIPFLVCVTGKTFCRDSVVIPCLMDLVQGPIDQVSFFGTVLSTGVCAK